MDMDQKGRKALVCGGSKGIGGAIAMALANEGAAIVLVSRSEAELRQKLSELPGSGHSYIAADMSNEADVQRLADYIKLHEVDIVVNNTGGPPPGMIADASISAFESALRMHLFASHSLMQAALPGMKRKGFGRFINVISTSVKIPINGLGVSNTTRGAMASWAKTLSNEVAPYGITVNNILPGAIETTRLSAIIADSASKAGITEAQAAEKMIGGIPAGRFGMPGEMGALAAFLASDQAGYITGVSIPVDGGRTGSL